MARKRNAPRHVVDGPSTIAGRLRPLGYKRYEEYLASEHWQDLRRQLLFGKRCGCGARATQLHHVTYVRLGSEEPEDLQPLCEICHKKAHGKVRRTRAKPKRKTKPKKKRAKKTVLITSGPLTSPLRAEAPAAPRGLRRSKPEPVARAEPKPWDRWEIRSKEARLKRNPA